MDPKQVTFDISRHYLHDRKSHLREDFYNQIFGAIRRRDVSFLASCTNLSTPALSGRAEWLTLMQMEAFFKKNAAFQSVNATRVAYDSFLAAEKQCEETNRRLEAYVCEHGHIDPDLATQLHKMKGHLCSILGPFREFLDVLPSTLKVTAGATATRSRRDALPFLRVSPEVSCTPGAWPYVKSLSCFFGYGEIKGAIRWSNRVEFVPKNWKTARTIACEPEGNVALQLAFDTYAKGRLRRFGINLSDQSQNQRLAKEGSISDKYATLDLSMASDTLAFNVVAHLFDNEWFEYLRAVRCPQGELTLRDGDHEEYHRLTYEKFSSMGNGSTFTIETLVFACCCRAVGAKDYSVYGDDIIITREHAEAVTKLLAFLGFTLNDQKSFVSGPFKESCGTNWFEGVDITPSYIRDLDDRKATQCHLVNSLTRVAIPFGNLEKYLIHFVVDQGLPLAPFNESSISGVWIHPYFAYSQKLIRTTKRRPWMLKHKAYVSKSGSFRPRKAYDVRCAFLWHLKSQGNKSGLIGAPIRNRPEFRRVKDSDPYAYDETSWYSTSSHKYVRKWVYWKIPVAGADDQSLFQFSQNLLEVMGRLED